MTDPQHRPRRRRTDTVRGFIRAHPGYPILTIALIGVLLYSTGKVDDTALKAERNAQRLGAQVQGRRVALDLLCGGLSGFGQAGRLVVLNDPRAWADALGPAEFARIRPFLRPDPREARLRAALGHAYNVIAVSGLIRSAGVDARGILRPDGTMDCAVLRRRARAAETDGGGSG